MTKLISLKSDSRFKSLLSKKKILTDYFTIYFGKILESENHKALNISFVIKKKIGNSIIRNRIKEYYNKTAILKDYYSAQDKYFGVDGVGSIEEITERLCAVIDKL